MRTRLALATGLISLLLSTACYSDDLTARQSAPYPEDLLARTRLAATAVPGVYEGGKPVGTPPPPVASKL